MRESRLVMAELASAGLTPDQLALVMELAATVSAEARPIVDKAAERKRAYDRERQREIARNRTNSHDTSENPSPLTPPLKSPPHPQKITPPITPQPSAKRAPTNFELPDWVPAEPWAAFEKMRKGMRAPFGPDAKRGIVGDLDRLRCEGHDPAKVLLKAVKLGWRGVFGGDDTRIANAGQSTGKAWTAAEQAEYLASLEPRRHATGPPGQAIGSVAKRIVSIQEGRG